MKPLRWSTTLVFLALGVCLLSVIAFLELPSASAQLIRIAALILFAVVVLFGRRGV